MPKAEQPPDSILLVALDTLAGTNVSTTDDILRNALRLINNCCQADGEWDRSASSSLLTYVDGTRQLVLENHGVSHMMRLAYRRVDPDVIVPALYNICVDNEPATSQLIHWKVGCSSIQAGHNLEDDNWQASPSEGALQVLLGVADALWHEERKPLLADLLELASHSG
jgi:hypothetical protein